MAKGADAMLIDIEQLTDIFFIGGTKNGALLAESAIRLITSWTTPETAIDEFIQDLKQH